MPFGLYNTVVHVFVASSKWKDNNHIFRYHNIFNTFNAVEVGYDNVRQRQIYKFNIRPEADKTEAYVQELKQHFPDLEVYQSGGIRIEVTAKGVSKGSGLEFLKTHYRPVVAFGDSGNDISMFEVAYISYCMSHAPKTVKEAATYIVDNFADAVTHLENLLDLWC